MRCPVVVGRDAELAGLAAAVDAAARGAGSCVLVRGEAGVGKTRLVRAAAAAAAARGLLTLHGRSTPTDRTTPLRPLAEALLGALRDRPPPDDPALRAYLPAVGTLVPHWADPEHGQAAVPPAPVLLAEAMLRTLAWYAGRAAMLVVEDLHWADQETMAVLEYLADHVHAFPVALVLTVRSDEPATAGVQAALPGAATVALQPLDGEAVAAMAAACLGVTTAPADLVERLRRAGGLPLVVEDLVALGGRTGPLRYAEIVTRRLVGLDPATREVVDAAAVLGIDVDVELLSAVGGLPADALDAPLHMAAACGLLVAAGGRPAFRHALTRDVVLAGMPAATRARLARAAARALEAAPVRAAVSGLLGELWAQAGENRRAAQALRRAARGARTAGATGTAETLLRRALACAPPDLSGPLRLDLLELLAVAGRVDELVERGSAALDELAHDAELTVAVRLLLARAAVAAGTPADAQPHLDAITAGPALGTRCSAQLRIVQGSVTMAGGDADRVEVTGKLATEAVELAERAGDPELTCEALELLATAARPRDLAVAAEVLRRVLAITERTGLVLWRLRALNELGTVELLRDARPDRLQRAFDLALRVGAVDIAASVAVNLAAVHAMTGSIGGALAAAAQARRLAGPLGATSAVAAAAAVEGVTHGFAGRRAEMERLLRQASDLAPDDADLAAFGWGAGRGLSALLFEERADALAAFDRARRLATPIRTLDPATGPMLLVRAVQGEDVRAEIEAERAAATAGARWATAWPAYAHSVVLGTAGDPAAAGVAFAEAERAADRYPQFRAIARRLVAESALAYPFGEPVAWLRDAEAEFVGRGLHRIAAACRGLLARAGEPVARRRGQDVALPAGLLRLGVTAREAEVLELVGEHLSNKDIGSRLYVSPRTVEKHVASLLRKTGEPDRAALTRRARHG